MAPHYSTLAWKIPWVEEPGRSLGVGHNWATSLSLFTFMHWKRKWQPTPVFLPGESQGRGSLVGCRLWGRPGSDTTEAMQQQQQQRIPESGLHQKTGFVCSYFLGSVHIPVELKKETPWFRIYNFKLFIVLNLCLLFWICDFWGGR